MMGVEPPDILAPGADFEAAYAPLCGQVGVRVFCQLGK